MNKHLKDYCDYVTEKISFEKLTSQNYIGIDNMLPNKQGVTKSSYVPEEGAAVSFKAGDVLIGNIRPYFKKVWLANFDGGCSPDVLCVRPKKDIASEFLYTILCQDSFFAYDMKGTKGSKMPRGDKDHIMNFPVCEIKDEKYIGNFIVNINCKIENNNKICAELENMAKTLYDYWFVQFDFPNENGKPYKTSGGKMVWNEELKREIPEGWKIKNFDNAFELVMGSSPLGETINENGDGVVFYQGKVDFGNRFPAIRTYTTAPIRFAEIGDILLSVRAPVGALNKAIEKCCIGRGIAAVKSKNSSFAFYTCAKLTPIFERYNGDGTTFGCIGKDQLSKIKVVMPDNCIMKQFENTVSVIDNLIEIREKENRELASLRDFLLPMLMNGQVTVN